MVFFSALGTIFTIGFETILKITDAENNWIIKYFLNIWRRYKLRSDQTIFTRLKY